MIKGDLVPFEPTTLKVPLNLQVAINFPKLEPLPRLAKEMIQENEIPLETKILIPLLKGPKEPTLFPLVREPGHEQECIIRTEPDHIADQPLAPDVRERMCRCHGVYDKRVDFADMTRKDRSASANAKNRSKSRPRSKDRSEEF